MGQTKRSIALFLSSALFGGILTAATGASAVTSWFRTVPGAGCTVHPPTGAAGVTTGAGYILCPMPSDWINGATSVGGKNVTNLYVDYLLGEISSHVTYLSINACTASYSSSVGSCAGAAAAPRTLGSHDVNVPIWSSSGSEWDYYYVSIMTDDPNGIILGGIGINGTN